MSAAEPVSRARVAESASRPVAGRIRGVDLARGLAVLGMVAVHIGPVRTEGFGLTGALYRLPHGRASILFVLVAGVGTSLLAGDRGRQRLRGTTARLLFGAAVLLPGGLALQTLPADVAVILHYYAFYFLLSLVAVRLPDRVLLALAALSALAGPVLLLGARRQWPGWFDPGLPAWDDAAHVARDLVLSGTYPAVVWAAPLLAGVWLGRRQLRARAAGVALLVCGLALAGACFGLRFLLPVWVGEPGSLDDWRRLATIEPHNGMPLWVLSSTGAAVAVLGLCLLLARALPRLTWPGVALGQLALTVYVGHVLVLAYEPGWLDRETFAAAWRSLGRFALVALAFVVIWRSVAPRGPVEALLHLPWWIGRRRATHAGGAAAARPAPAGEA